MVNVFPPKIFFSKFGNFFAQKTEIVWQSIPFFIFDLHLASVIWHPSSHVGVLKKKYFEYHIMKEFLKKTSDNFDIVLYKGLKVGAFVK